MENGKNCPQGKIFITVGERSVACGKNKNAPSPLGRAGVG